METSVEDAVKKAKYNEAVVVSATNPDDPLAPPEELVLVAQLDDVNGGITWNRIPVSSTDDINNDDDVGILQHLRTKRWVLPMLNDQRRNDLYNEAIRRAAKEALKRMKETNGKCRNGNEDLTPSSSHPTIRALDIGSGTGLLAMMVAHHLHDEIQQFSDSEATFSPSIEVTSLEMSSAMARLAQQTIASNEMDSTIRVAEAYSLDVSLDPKAHICISELLESGLLGEGVLPSLRDAWKRLLHPNAVVVPQRARVFAQVLEGRESIGHYWGPHTSDESLKLSLSTDESHVMLGSAHDGIIVSLHAGKVFAPTDSEGSDHHDVNKLCEPVEVLSFDFSSPDVIPDEDGRSQTISFVPTRTGTAHGVLFWWELDLWDGLTYTTECGKQPWQDHWHQCLYVFPEPDAACQKLIKGETTSLLVHHNDYRISFELRSDEGLQNLQLKRRRSDRTSDAISPQRAKQLNCKSRLDNLRAAVAFAVAHKGVQSAVLDVSDFSLGAILAALEGAKNVTSVESSAGNVAQMAARVAQLANGLPQSGASFQVLQCYPEQLTLDAIPGLDEKRIEIVVAEPYYEILEGWHLQEAMNFYFLVRALRTRNVVQESASVVPSFAVVKGAAISCSELWKAYAACGDGSDDARVGGFKHHIVNRYGVRFDDHVMCFASWQYDVTRLTEPFELGRLQFEDDMYMSGSEVRVSFSKPGICHGLLVRGAALTQCDTLYCKLSNHFCFA